MNYKKIISMVCLFAISFEIFPVQALNYVYAETRLEAQIGDSNEKTEEKVNSEKKEKVEDSTIKQDAESEDNTVKQEVESEDNTIKQEVESGDSNTHNEGNESAEPTKILGSSLVRTYLGEAFDAKAGIKAIDSNGKDITDSVSIEGKVDTNKVGSYELKYSVKDEAGKIATLTRKVNVINKNIFNTFIEKVNEQTKEKTKELGFSIYLDNNISKFLVENQSKEKLDPAKKDEVVFKIRVIDKDNKEKLKVELLGDDTGDSEKLNPLKELEYSFGDYIEIHSTNAKNGFNIEGEMSGDIDTKKSKDEKNSENVKKEDYSDGVDNMDYLSNVRFKITEEGIETVYNNAPEISGLEPMEKLLTNRKNQLEGIKVTDDHDGVIANNKIVITEEKDDKNNVIALKYKVSDSWGRSTEATRVVTLKELTSNFSSAPTNTLTNNSISVKGIRFGTNSQYGDADTRFKVTFNDRSRKIYVVNQDGRSMNSRVKDTYFKMTLYDSKGNVKKEVAINGDERSNTSKLDELRFYGWSYQYGDQISLWHYEAPVKIRIDGNVEQEEGKDSIDFTSQLTKKLLEETRFELTSEGLKHALNEPPVITFPEGKEKLVVNRGDDIDLMEGVEVTDDREGVKWEVSPFDPIELGDHTVTYTATDNWGVQTIKEREVTVNPKNQIEEVSIKVKSIDGTSMFSIGFDEIKKRFILKAEETGVQINPKNNSIELSITVFNKFNTKKREFKIAGKDTVNSSSIQKINNYKYEEGDYLQITPNTTSLVTIHGKIENVDNGLNYETGVDDLDKWKNVRFQLDKGKIHYNYNEAPVISGNTDMEVIRGESFNILNEMKVNDDQDGQEINLTDSNTVVTLKSGKDIFIGKQVYEIKYTDSWGRTSSVERVVNIKPKNPVEEQKIELFDGDKTVLSFSYDSIEKKFKVLSYDPEYSFINSEEENAFALEFYDYESNTKQESVVLKSEDLIDSDFLNELTGIVVQDRWYMKLWYHDASKLKITSKNTTDSDIIFDDDKMENTRFEISDAEITSIYNRAPEINGVEDVSIVYGTTFDKMKNVTVNDEYDKLVEAVIVMGEVDTNELGPQVLHYEVTDQFGRRTVKNRTVTVVPVYTINEVKYFNDSNKEMFSIGINEAATGFTVNLPKEMPTETYKSIFNFKVFNEKEEKVYELNVDSKTNINEALFKGLKELIIRPGYSFSVNSSDLTKIKITEELNKSQQQISSVDYNNLTNENRDAVDNVRFKLTENIVQVIYNEAPQIIVEDGREELIRNQAVTIEDYDLLDGLSIQDDRDTEDELTIDKIEILLPEDKDILTEDLEKAKDLIGETVVITYQVADSWGRYSEKVTRELTIESAMDDITIDFLHAAVGGVHDMIPSYDRHALEMKFNMNNNSLNLTRKNQNSFKGNEVQYGAFAILDKDNNEEVKFAAVLGSGKDFEKEGSIFKPENIGEYNWVQGFIDAVNNKKRELESQNKKLIEYGDKLIIKIYQSPFLHIKGKVLDNQEDYSKGAKIGGILENSKFEVTPAGLKQIYTGPTMHESKFSQLTIFNVIAGIQSVNIYLDNSNPENLVLRAEALDNEWIDTKNSGNSLRIEIRNANGTFKEGATYIGRTSPSDIAEDFEGMQVETNGYLTLKWFNSNKVKNSKLYNLPSQYGFPKEVDYSGDITDATYFNDVRFYFTKKGIVPVYNSAPTFEGIEDKSISLGENFDNRNEVTVHDDHDKGILNYRVDGTVDITRVGENTLTYSATDSWGRTGRYERKVYVKPKVHENHFEVYDKDNEKSFSIDFEPELTEGAKNGKLKVTQFSDKPLDINRPTDKIFEAWVYGENGEIKESVTLLGRDNSSSENLNKLNEFPYESGDYIKVWKAPNLDSTNAAIEGLEVNGNTTGDSFDFTDTSKGMDYMNNTIFYIKPTGLEASYNRAPELQGVKDIVIYYGDTNYDLLNGVTATDEDEEGKLNVTVTPETIDINRLGKTEITYSVTDSIGRTTSQTANVTVRSKSYLNYFGIYENSASGQEELKLAIGFNSDVNAFEFYNSSGIASLDEIELSAIPSDLNIIVYSRFGREKQNIQLSESDDEDKKKAELNKLKSIKVDTLDMIQISTSDYSKVKVKGNESNPLKNYEKRFNSEQEMKDVRFQVKNEGLKEVRRVSEDQVTFNGLEKLTIKRGDQVNLLDKVTVSHPNEILIDVTFSGFNNLTVGTQTVTYSVQDSWGTTFTATRVVEVLPYNDLEKVKITVSDIDRTELINVKFDSIESTLSYELNNTSSLVSKLRRALSFAKELPDEKVILTVSTFNKDMALMDEVSVTKGDIVNGSSNLNDINNVSFAEGGFIGIDIYDFNNSNALEITGPVTYPDKSKKFYNDMRHVRYEISENGIKATYNEAPEVTTQDVEHRVSDDFDLKTALKITDDRDSLDFIEVEFSEYENYTVGKQEVTATVTDLWGLATTAKFNVYVLSYLDDNSITLKSDTGKEIVTVGFDSKSGNLEVNFHRKNDGTPILSSSSNEDIISLNIYNDEHKKTATIPFRADDTVTSIKEKLERGGFKDYQYHYNYFIGLEVKENAKSLISITNAKKEGEELASVNYENGVEDIDYFNNVRFELNPYGLTAIYNKAPILNNTFGDIKAVKSRNVDDYDLLRGIEIADDKDKLSLDEIDIKYNGSDESSSLELGDNTITLTIRDTWGRESLPVKFKLNLTSAMDDIKITFLYAGNGLKPDLNKKAAVLKFNMNEGKILVENFEDVTDFKFNNIQYGALGIYNESDELVFRTILGGDRKFENGTEFQGANHNNLVTGFKSYVERFSGLDYGYKIKIKIYQSPFVYIDGSVINAQENYAEGAYLSEILNESTFTITKEGLEQNYTKPGSNSKNNDIVWLSGVAGDKLFNINVNPDTQRLTVTKFTNEPLDTLYHNNSKLFSIDVYDSNGNRSYGIDATTRQSANDIVRDLNNQPFEINGYLTIKIHPTDRNRVRNMKIYGDIIKPKDSLEDVDYSGEIKDVAYFNESRFYFTENGLSLSYNDAPAFTGLTDVILLKDEGEEEINLKEDVRVYDDNTENLEYRIEDADGNVISNPESFRPRSLGAHEVYYIATDSLNRTTREPRFIWLQSASTIEVKDDALLTIQEADPKLQTDEAILEYLINLVTVYDEEDNENGKPIQVTEENIKGRFDPNKPGTYPIIYTVQDSDGNISQRTFEINVVRTISVSVPTYIPFQLVTNLIKKENQPEPDPFISGIMKVTNNYLTDVDVYLKEFTKTSEEGGLEIVEPDRFPEWDNLTEEETMKYMALGIYNKSNFNNSSYTEESPLWLKNNSTNNFNNNSNENSNKNYIGRLPKATDLNTPNVAQLSFVSKHGKKFIGGTTKAKFGLTLEFR